MNSVNFKPIYNRVLIIKNEPSMETMSGLVLLKNNDDIFTGKIVAIGAGKFSSTGVFINTDLSVGDVVYFEKSVGVPLTLEGVKYILMNEEDILAIENRVE